MRITDDLLRVLCCPGCRADLELISRSTMEADGHVMEGQFVCRGCSAVYPIERGVPRFARPPDQPEVARTVAAFSYEWTHADAHIWQRPFSSAEVFLDFIDPVQERDFVDAVVLDAGCGAGRFTTWAQKFGARRVVGVDLSDAVDVAFRVTRNMENVLIVQADLFQLPLRSVFDYIFSVGVLHHTPDPEGAFLALTSLLRPGGRISVWVYGQEGNHGIIRALNVLRRALVRRMSWSVLWLFSGLLTVPLYILTRGVYRPIAKRPRLAPLRRFLGYYDYLQRLGQLGFQEQRWVVFDQLAPAINAYISRDQIQEWFRKAGLVEVHITSRAGNSWRGFGVRPGVAGDSGTRRQVNA